MGAYSIIEDGCEVGDNTKIENYVLLEKNTKLGKDVHICSRTIIGANPPPPYEADYNFGTIIEDTSNIGSGCAIVRGITRDTLIKNNVVVRHLSNIGHDSIIGENSSILSGSILCGFVDFGKESYIGVSTDVRQRAKIGDYVYIGMGSLVIGDIPNYSYGYGRPVKILGRTDDIKIRAMLLSQNLRRRIRRVL